MATDWLLVPFRDCFQSQPRAHLQALNLEDSAALVEERMSSVWGGLEMSVDGMNNSVQFAVKKKRGELPNLREGFRRRLCLEMTDVISSKEVEERRRGGTSLVVQW